MFGLLGTVNSQDLPTIHVGRPQAAHPSLVEDAVWTPLSIRNFASGGLLEIESTDLSGNPLEWKVDALVPQISKGTNESSFEFLISRDVPVAMLRARHHLKGTIRHRFDGTRPELLGGVAYGVDEQTGFNLEYTLQLIRSAADLARSNNLLFAAASTNGVSPIRLSPFHFWPNILDLGLIQQGDEALYAQIVGEILEGVPAGVGLAGEWRAGLQRGERIFLARDFVSAVHVGSVTWHEVHFAMVINLDAPGAGELQVHRLPEGNGLVLEDPRVGALRDSLARAESLPLGKVWDICLRGNHRRSHHQGLLVEKIQGVEGARLHLIRVEQSCGGGGAGPPPTDDPPPEEEPPIKVPPPRGGDGSNGDRKKWSLARLPPVIDGKAPGRAARPQDPLDGPEQPGNKGGQQPGAQLKNEVEKIRQWLGQMEEAARQSRAAYDHDRERLGDMSDSWIEGVQFKDPCLQAIYDKKSAEVAALKQKISGLNATNGECVRAMAAAKLAASPVIRVLLSKSNIWVNVVQGSGPWSNLIIDCPPPMLFGYSPMGERVSINVDRFSSDVIRRMQQGSSWAHAIDQALANPANFPEGVPVSNRAVQLAFREWARCLRLLYEAKFRLALAQYYSELSAAQRERMISVLFDCDKDFSALEKTELADLLSRLAAGAAKSDALSAQADELLNEINTETLRCFHAEAAPCRNESAFRLRMLLNRLRILKAALVEAATPGAPGSTPGFWGPGPDGGRGEFCETLRQMLGSPEVQNCPGLRAHLMSLLEGTCGR